MKTLLEFCEVYRISLRKAKRMQKAGDLRILETLNPDIDRIRQTLMAYNPLSTVDLCYMLENPAALLEFGKHSARVADQVADLGDALRERAPVDIAAAASQAARGDLESAQALADWIKSALPGEGESVRYPWLACRVLLALPANIRALEAPGMIRAFAKARKMESFAGWSRVVTHSGRKSVIYARPKNSLASLDL